MRRLCLVLLLAACGGGSALAPEVRTFCQFQISPGLYIVPGYVHTVDGNGNVTVEDDYGFVAYGWTAAEDWQTLYVVNGGFPAIDPDSECLTLPPESLLGRYVLDYSLGRPGEFVLVDDLEAFLNR